MPSNLLLRCLARAAAKNAVKFLLHLVPGGEVVYDIAADAWADYRQQQQHEADQRAEVQALAQAPADQVRQDVLAAVQAEAADLPPEAQQALTIYLSQVPPLIRRSLRRPSDPTGTTVPPDLVLRQPEDLLPFLPPRPPRFRPGDRPLPGVDWVLEDLLGVGGFGEVWKARHVHLHSRAPVALKFCLDPSAVPALRNEAGVLDRVMQHGRHPGIVPLLNTYLSADPPCLEYEFVEGGDLAGLIQDLHARGRMTPDAASRLVLRLAEIVAFAHRADPPIVHADLKPANTLVRRGGDGKVALRVTDFGIGGLAAARAVRETRQPTRSRQELLTEAVRGAYTPLYASPEQMRRQRGDPADPRDDVHALGVIWLQALSGDLGMMSVPPDWREQVEERGLGNDLVRLLASCLASKADKRPASAVVLAEQLGALLPSGPAVPAPGPRQADPAPVADSPAPPTPDDLAAQLETALQGVAQAHAQARRLADQRHDYAAAVQVLERVPDHLRDRALYDSVREAAALDREVREAVAGARTAGLRPKVVTLLELHPGREDLRRLLERLPKELQPGEVVTIHLGQTKTGGVLGFGGKTIDVAMKFAWIPPGTFLMGSPPDEEEREGYQGADETQHKATLTKGYYLGIHPVTQAAWQAIMGTNPSRFKGEDRPVEQVSWDDCQKFCKELSKRDGKRHRLPTEADWEYACRAGTETAYSFGSDAGKLGDFAWFGGNSGGKTHSVGQKEPNRWGLFDMHGNVWEWCQDWYGPYPKREIKDPVSDQKGTARVVRGGSWCSGPRYCRSAFRGRLAPAYRRGDGGFRVVLCLD